MKRTHIAGILALTIVIGSITGCGNDRAKEEADIFRAGELTMLNVSEEDYAKHQIRTKSQLDGIESGEIKGEEPLSETPEDNDTISAEFVYYDDLSSMLLALEAGDIEAIHIYSDVARYICSTDDSLQIKDLYEETDKEETRETIDRINTDAFSFMLTKKNNDLRNELDQAIFDMKSDGTLDKLVKEYIDAVIDGKRPVAIEIPEIDGADTLKVAITGDLPPFDYISPDGNPEGFNTAVLAEIGKRIGKNIDLVDIESGARSVALASGEVDVVFWTRGSVEGLPREDIPPEGEGPDPDGKEPSADLPQPLDDRDISERPDLPNGNDQMLAELDQFKKRDMPEGTIVTGSYYSDRYVMLTKK